ncbi:Ribokinase-like protein, partial [Aureobasidium melanogenum]
MVAFTPIAISHSDRGFAAASTMVSPLPTICVLGSLNIDLVYYTPHHPSPGETLTSTHSNVSPGGKGANQAVACAKLSRSRTLEDASIKVVMFGAVGADTHGSTLLESLQSYGVDVSEHVRRQGGAEHSTTGNAVVMVDERTGQNRIIFTPGANASLRPESVSNLANLRPSLLVMQLEIPLDTVLQALAAAKSVGVPVLLNPAPAFQLPEEAYSGLSHLILNETEVALLAQVDEAELDDLNMVEKTASKLLAKGVQNLVITLGARGAYYMSKNGQNGFVPALKVNVVDTTAAGDTFIGMYSVLVVEASSRNLNFDICAAVAKSTFASAKTVSRRGAQVSIPWKDELILE